MNNNNDIVDPSLVALEEWNSLILNPNFSRLREYISNSIERYRLDIEKESKNPMSLDTSLKIAAITVRMDELKRLISHFKYWTDKKLATEKQGISVPTN